MRRDPFRAAKLLLVLAVALGAAKLLSVGPVTEEEKNPRPVARIVPAESSATESAPTAEKARTTHEAP